jgi:hypothetical protein
MSHFLNSVSRQLESYGVFGGRSSSAPSGKDLKRIVGGALMAVGAIFILYGAGSGLSTLIRMSLDHFGLVFLSSTISFIFWTIMLPPLGGIAVNAASALAAVLLFSGIPAIPGAVMAAGGAVLYLG